jgi:N-acetylneuraminate synthase
VRTGPSPGEVGQRRFRRSLYVVADVDAGEPFSAANVRSIRPALGLHPRCLDVVIGRTASRAIRRGEPLAWDMVEGGAPEAQEAGHG